MIWTDYARLDILIPNKNLTITSKPILDEELRTLVDLPNRPLLESLPRIDTTPFTDVQRKGFQPKKVKTIKPFAPTIQKVKEIVPNKMIPKLKPLTTAAR